MVYGLGLQFMSFAQRGLKKLLRVNADPKMDSGDSHAPVPFYVTTRGYGVLVDTARYPTFYCGNKHRKERTHEQTANGAVENALPAAYRKFGFGEHSRVLIEIPRAPGIDVYVFGGPTMREAIQRYNLYSGGGALPPRWGLGVWYRCSTTYSQDEVLQRAADFRESKIPCDVLGLEPGWQTHAYSCTYVWSGKFPDPRKMIDELSAKGYRLNLWEHAFTNPASPIYQPLYPHSGDFEVWGGLVPDFLSAGAREVFAAYHEKAHVALGVSGYKLDECDNSDFTGNWSFPEIGSFPSGADGEQMHSVFGQRYQDTIQSIFERRKQRTYGLVRSSGALAAPYPYVLYSDLYDHSQFIRALVNSGFSGLLWTPEVRDAASEEDLIRRIQTTVLSPLALINAWYIQNPPWKQIDREENNAGRYAADWEQLESRCRSILNLRMQLVPYVHAAFVRYHLEGVAPVRALVIDYPQDANTYAIDNQYLFGDSLLVAPVVAGERQRSVYLPEGDWFNFWSGQRYTGKQHVSMEVPLEQIPLFVKSGTILPLARVTPHTGDPDAWKITAHGYGSGSLSAELFEEDGGVPPKISFVALLWEPGQKAGMWYRGPLIQNGRYSIVEWKRTV